jgi:hypothetical protein
VTYRFQNRADQEVYNEWSRYTDWAVTTLLHWYIYESISVGGSITANRYSVGFLTTSGEYMMGTVRYNFTTKDFVTRIDEV